MSVTLWLLIAFAVGVLFGRLTARSGTVRAPGPTGIGPAANSGSASALQFGQDVPAAVGTPNGAYRITLLDRGPNLIRTIKAVREVTRFGLKDAKDTVESAPREIARVDSANQAQAIVRAFQGIANVRLDGPAETPLRDYGYASGSGAQQSG